MQNRWYLMRSKPRKEDALCQYARQAGLRTYYPRVERVFSRGAEPVWSPFFPGYIFVEADLCQVGESLLHWMPFSIGLVRMGGEPALVEESIIVGLKKRMAQLQAGGGLAADPFTHGDRVRFIDGAFEGYEAVFDLRLSGSERVRVLLELVNRRQMAIETHASLLQKIG